MNLLIVILWGVAGIATLCLKEIPKFSYAVCWMVLMVYLIARLM